MTTQADETAVLLFVDRLWIEASVKTGGYRLLDILNDPMHEYLEIYDARVTSGGSATEPELTDAVITKSSISVAVIQTDRHEAEERRRFIAVEKKRYPAVLFIDGFEVRGTVHLDGPPEASIALAGELESFFAITGASLRHVATGERFDAPVVMPNKSLLSMIHIGERIRTEAHGAA